MYCLFFYKQSVKSKASWSIPNVVSVYALVLPPPPTASSLAVGTTLLYLLIFVTCISFKCQELNNAKILKGSNFEVILTFLEWCNLLFLLSISRDQTPPETRHHPFHYLKSQLSIYCALFCLEHNKHSFSFFIANVHIQNLGCCLCVNQF